MNIHESLLRLAYAKYFLVVFFFITINLILLSACNSVKRIEQSNNTVVVLYENDVHCAIDGYSRLAGLRDAISDTAYAVAVSCGDFLQGGPVGALSKGKYIVDIMNSVGYGAITLGNHEFDYKTPRMLKLMKKLNAPITCVNFKNVKTGERYYAPYVVKSIGGGKSIGFVGVVTPSTLSSEGYAFFDEQGNQLYDLCENEVFQLVQESVDKLRQQGVTYVVLLSHLGESSELTMVNSHALIRSTTGIDVVLDGHSHSVIPSETVPNKDGKLVLISETGTRFAHVGKLTIRPDGHMTTELIPMKDIPFINQKVTKAINKVQSSLDKMTSRPICRSEVKLRILDDEGRQQVRYAETNAGDLVTDAYRLVTGADFAMSNGGGIRCDLPSGQLTYGDLVTLLPFDNYVCTVDITGAQLKHLLSECTQFSPEAHGDFPQVSGIKFTVNRGKEERITDLEILNKSTNQYEPVNMNRSYSLATIDYCITGGGFHGLLKENHITKSNIILYNECLAKYVSETLGGHIGQEYAQPQGRISFK